MNASICHSLCCACSPVSESLSALEQCLQTLQRYREQDVASREVCELLAQVLSQVCWPSTHLAQQHEAIAAELLGDQHSPAFAAETAMGIVAELATQQPTGVQR